MELQQFIRKPFKIQAVMITEDNIEEVAGLIGELKSENGEPYILLNRRIVPNIKRAFVGYYLTLLGDNYRVYAPKVFQKEFIEHSDVIAFDFCDDDADPVVRLELLKAAVELAEDEAVDLLAEEEVNVESMSDAPQVDAETSDEGFDAPTHEDTPMEVEEESDPTPGFGTERLAED